MFSSLSRLYRLARDAGPQIARDAAVYRMRKSFYDLRHPTRRPGGAWRTPGAVLEIEKYERGTILRCERGALRLTVIAPDCVQVRWLPRNGRSSDKFPVPFSYAVAKVTWPDTPFKISESDESITLDAGKIICSVTRLTGRVRFSDEEGRALGGDADGIAWHSGQSRLTRTLPPPAEALCVGLAEQPVGLDVRGHRYQMWNTSPTRYERGTIPIYYTIPFYIDVYSDRAAGCFWDNPGRGWIDAGKANPGQMTFESDSGELRYYVFAGANVADVLARYTELTGRMPLPPLWALGLHQSRWSYTPADRVREIAVGFRKRKIPCDAIHLDIDYMDGYRCFTWDRARFPSPAVLVGDLLADGFKTIVILDPGLKVDPQYAVDQSGLKEDVFVKYPGGKPFTGPVWAGVSHFPDFTDPKARAWWAAQFESLAKIGIAGVWNDMNEPVLFNLGSDRQMPDNVRHAFEGQAATHVEAHNLYGTTMARASRDGLEKWWPDKRPFNITRAAYAGAQRYASTWTGDNSSTWDHLRLSISMTLNCGLSGMAFTGPDTGGFGGDAEPELFVRWVQLSALLPFFRIHTAKNTRDQEPWSFGQPYEDIVRKYIELRYQLLPYLYSAFAQCAQTGLPIVRPLFMADPADLTLRSAEDAFLLGDNLLSAPVVEKGATGRDVYLPRGRWYNFWTQEAFDGGQTIHVEAPLDTLPLYVRAGAVIPLWPVQQYVGQGPVEELQLKAYVGNGEDTLYEDAGEGLAYQRGEYRWLYFTCTAQTDGGLKLTWRRAGQYTPNYKRIRVEVYGISTQPQSILLDGQSAPLWYFENGIVEFTINTPFSTVEIIPASESPAASTLLRPPHE
ncbi:MAG: glycoside hydrolase family 31 protein [Aggregatilineales bacterium]